MTYIKYIIEYEKNTGKANRKKRFTDFENKLLMLSILLFAIRYQKKKKNKYNQ